jgi:hypothetical protein
MKNVRLEINQIKIHCKKKRWLLYFIVMVDHPSDKEKMVMSILPENAIRLTAFNQNIFQFDTKEAGSEGLFILSRLMPESRELDVHIYVRHSRKSLRNLSSILKDVETGLGGETFGIVSDIAGTAVAPWLIITKKATHLLGNFLSKKDDRDLGFINAYEKFGNEFDGRTQVRREKSAAECSVRYSWSIE